MKEERGCLYTGLLMLVLLGGVISIAVNILLLKSSIEGVETMSIAIIIISMLQIISVFFIISNRKIGLYIYIGTAITNLIINIFNSANIFMIIAGLIMPTLICVFSKPYYKEMK